VDLVKFKSVSFPNISVAPPLPLLVANVVGGEGSILLYEGEIRDVLITLTNAGTVPVEEANIVLSGKNQDSVISIAHSTWKSALPIKPGGEVTFAVTLRAWHLSLADSEADGSRSPANSRRTAREGINPFLDIHYAGRLQVSDSSLLFAIPEHSTSLIICIFNLSVTVRKFQVC
jgi:trafficking protein particle complex subunit 9